MVVSCHSWTYCHRAANYILTYGWFLGLLLREKMRVQVLTLYSLAKTDTHHSHSEPTSQASQGTN